VKYLHQVTFPPVLDTARVTPAGYAQRAEDGPGVQAGLRSSGLCGGDGGQQYAIKAVVTHEGPSPQSGHYTEQQDASLSGAKAGSTLTMMRE